MRHRILGGFGALLLVAGLAVAQKYSPPVQESIELVRKHIDKMENGKGNGEVRPLNFPAVKKALPNHRMVAVRFRQFPVARIMPEGLGASNVFSVNKEGKIEHVKDVKALQKFFHAHQAPVKSPKDAKTIMAAWLTLTQEYHQDGMFKFEILDKELETNGAKVTGRLIVKAGGNGQLTAELQFDKDGKLAKAMETAKIRPGPRPICQATKLLDADPLVRRICEQDLLIMGLLARDYLREQRAKATPELRREIDRLWQQIQKNGW